MDPLRFEPLFRRYLWGGRRLATMLGKQIGPEDDFAESWEIVDHAEHQSVVTDGPLAGRPLAQLISEFGPQILGPSIWSAITDEAIPGHLRGRFPLLLKILDANRTLSVQVHPDDAMAKLQTPPDLGKTEAWYVLDAEPGSVIYAGLKPGVDRSSLEQAVQSQSTQELLHKIYPKPGDCIFVPAGTVHAIGSGLLIIEIQQSSDTTFRLFDWNRTDATGNSRQLHIDQALDATNYSRGPVTTQSKTPTELQGVYELVVCENFVMRHWTLNDGRTLETQNKFRLLIITKGKLRVASGACEAPLQTGQSMLIPASLRELHLEPIESSEFLEFTLP